MRLSIFTRGMVALAFAGVPAWAGSAATASERPTTEAGKLAKPGSHRVIDELGDWVDRDRKRTIPYKIYRPVALDRPAPIILFSHGLGGNREGAAYLNRYLASHGFVVVALQHPGSDASLLDEEQSKSGNARGMLLRGANMHAAQDRYRDVGFAIDRVSDLNKNGHLAGKLDLSRIGMSGHSFGAVTTLVAAGQRVGLGGSQSFREPRIKAAAAYSPNRPAQGNPEKMLADVKIPMLHMTGTLDGSVLGRAVTVEDRKVPFRAIRGAPQYLVVLTDGDHMVFSGRRLQRGRPSPTDPRHIDIIQAASLAFWKSHLLGDDVARVWLESELATAVGADAAVSHHQ